MIKKFYEKKAQVSAVQFREDNIYDVWKLLEEFKVTSASGKFSKVPCIMFGGEAIYSGDWVVLNHDTKTVEVLDSKEFYEKYSEIKGE